MVNASSATALAVALLIDTIAVWRRFTLDGNLSRLTGRRASRRRAAVAFLAKHGGSSYRSDILARLKDSDRSVRQSVRRVVDTLGVSHDEIATALVAVVQDIWDGGAWITSEARIDALAALSQYGEHHIDAIVAGFSRYSENEYHTARETLRTLSAGPESTAEAYVKAFSSPNLSVREHAFRELEKYPTERVRRVLVEALHHDPDRHSWPDQFPSKMAVGEMLARLGEPAGVEALYSQLDHADLNAFEALLRVGENPEAVLSRLLQSVHYAPGDDLVEAIRELVVVDRRGHWDSFTESAYGDSGGRTTNKGCSGRA
jgi:HEAT repeat protein